MLNCAALNLVAGLEEPISCQEGRFHCLLSWHLDEMLAWREV